MQEYQKRYRRSFKFCLAGALEVNLIFLGKALGKKGQRRKIRVNCYTYGFNGKERDQSFGNVHYDYGFRIYNPSIGKFLSVDPLTASYPWYTPYQFAGNTPIQAIDLDGLEEFKVIGKYHFGETEITLSTPRTVQEEVSYIYNFNSGRTNGFISGLNPFNQLESFADFIQSQSTRNHYYIITDNNGTQYLVHPSEIQLDISFEQLAYNEGYAQGFNEGGLTFDIATALLGEINIAKRLYNVYKLSSKGTKGEGIIYRRIDVAGEIEKPYVGQAKNEQRYSARQKEHARANPDSDFEFEIIDRGDADGSFPTDLDVKEQRALDALNGPTNKSNPNGGTSNKKNVIKQ